MEVDSVKVEDEKRVTQQRFEAAVKVIKSLPPNGPFQPSNDMMLKFYSYYKQATVGPCNIPRPRFWDAVGRAKWDAWDSLGDMPKEAAMAAYVDEIKLILEGMPMTDEVEELLRVLGPFYELIDQKKKITQISDLSTGFGTMLNSTPSKSVAKSIVRTMEMNGTLEVKRGQFKSKEVREGSEKEAQEEEEEEEDNDDDDEEDDEDDYNDDMEGEEEVVTQKETKAVSQPKENESSRRHKVLLSNGKVANGGLHLTNGSHSRTGQNGDSQEGSVNEPLLNGHLADHDVDVSGPNHMASDSDSEVYCDSVDQFGQEENSVHNHSLEDTDEEENHILEPQETQDDAQGPPHVVRCGGQDGETGMPVSQRHKLNADMKGSSLFRRGRGPKSQGHYSGALLPIHGGRDGDGSNWGGAVTPGESLNEQIVVVLARLQEDMQSVLERLHTLEALTTSQARSVALSPTYASAPVNKKKQKPSWWPFDISPTSLAFAVIWPLVVQWLICLYLQRRRRRIN